jgi:hypothetical protein
MGQHWQAHALELLDVVLHGHGHAHAVEERRIIETVRQAPARSARRARRARRARVAWKGGGTAPQSRSDRADEASLERASRFLRSRRNALFCFSIHNFTVQSSDSEQQQLSYWEVNMDVEVNPYIDSDPANPRELQKAVSDIIRDQNIYPDIFNKWPTKKTSTFWKPFSSWKDKDVKFNDCVNVDRAVEAIGRVISNDKNGGLLSYEHRKKNHKNLQDISAAAKNRAEVLTDKADYYPIYAVVIGLAGKFLIDLTSDGIAPQIVDLGFSFIVLAFVASVAVIRVNLKREIAFLKICSNLVDLADKRFAPLKKEKEEGKATASSA